MNEKLAFPLQTVRVSLPKLAGNPFDSRVHDVRLVVTRPDQSVIKLPMFFDGGTAFVARFRPQTAGAYRIERVEDRGRTVTVSGLAKGFRAGGRAESAFVRIDPKRPGRFLRGAAAFYPLGHNAAWKSDSLDIPEIFGKMAKVGENWSRVWMCHWSGANLDWPAPGGEPGALSLDVARYWDRIVESAERENIAFQLVLQHHGQYSTTVNPNWNDNPWNAKNGGFLSRPEEFFTHPEARRRTKDKYRYILARYGHSPAVLAWELFNEVQFTDSSRNKKFAEVAAWHREMADFLRAEDIHGHLVTTSSDTSQPGLFDSVDFVQAHAYEPDPIITARTLSWPAWKKPVFFGEIGPEGDNERYDAAFLKPVLWASLMSESSGAACFWAWDRVDRKNLYTAFAPVAAFLKATKLGERDDCRVVSARSETPGAGGSLSFSPGVGYGPASSETVDVAADGVSPMIGKVSRFLHGKAHPELPQSITLSIETPSPTTLSVVVTQSSRGGAELVISLDRAEFARKSFAAADRDTPRTETISVPIPAGKHTISLTNPGADWLILGAFTLSPFGSALRVVAKAAPDLIAAWVVRSAGDKPVAGTVEFAHRPGRWSVAVYSTRTGAAIGPAKVVAATGGTLKISTPAIETDIAIIARRV